MAKIPFGKSSFVLNPSSDLGNSKVKAWMYNPKSAGKNSKIVFVLHGADRNGEEYRDSWADLSEKAAMLVVAPEFSVDSFGYVHGYNLGNILSIDGIKNDKSEWSFSIIEKVFDQLRNYGATAASYCLFGHSAGAQFVHRMVSFFPEARVDVAIASSAGWYTFPTREVAFPYGLGDSVIEDAQLRAALGKQLVLLLGENDNDPNHNELNRSREAMAQGTHRLERGTNYFRCAQNAAQELGVNFRWKCVVVPGVGHDYRRMSEIAATQLLMGA